MTQSFFHDATEGSMNCVAVAMNNDGSIHCDHGTGTLLTKEFEATYLGNEINKTVNIQFEI